jgi:hypothetical protein
VCEPHLLQKYGCIEFEDGSSTGSSPGAKFGENPKKKKAIAIYQKLRCYSGSRHLPKIAILRPSAFFLVYGENRTPGYHSHA